MKKLLYIVLPALLLLSGCEKKISETAPAELFVMNGEETAAGVRPGDGPDEFKAAYSGYTLEVAWNDTDSGYIVMSADDIPYNEEISTIIANLFINGMPTSLRALCQTHDISSDEVHALISSPDYLRAHDVVYRYLDFDWENGKIADITSGELNYNETFETPRTGT